MIFSTRYLNEETTQSIFYKQPLREDKKIVLWKCRRELCKIDSLNVFDVFNITENPMELADIAEILLKYYPDYAPLNEDFKLIASNLTILSTKVIDCIQNFIDVMQDECIENLAPYILPESSFGYILKEEVYKENEDNVIYRAIGIMHLPEGHRDEGKEWAKFLVEQYSFGTIDDEEIILCLHTGTDWEKEDNGEQKIFAKKLSESLSKNIIIQLYHHQEQSYTVAKQLLHGENLRDVWTQIYNS